MSRFCGATLVNEYSPVVHGGFRLKLEDWGIYNSQGQIIDKHELLQSGTRLCSLQYY